MTNETNKPLAETKQLRGTFDQVIRQINSEYHETNGWAVVRSANTLVSFTVWVERSVKQAPTVNAVAEQPVNTLETPEKDAATNVKVATTEVESKVVKTTPKTTTKKTTEKKDV